MNNNYKKIVHPQKMALSEYSFLNNFTIVCSDGEIEVESSILARMSPFFCKLLKNDMLEKQTKSMTLNYQSAIVTTAYLFSLNIMIESKEAESAICQLIEFAHLYEMKKMFDYYVNKLLEDPSVPESLFTVNRIYDLKLKPAEKFLQSKNLVIYTQTSTYIYLVSCFADNLIDSKYTDIRKYWHRVLESYFASNVHDADLIFANVPLYPALMMRLALRIADLEKRFAFIEKHLIYYPRYNFPNKEVEMNLAKYQSERNLNIPIPENILKANNSFSSYYRDG